MVKLAVEGELGRWLEPATVELSSEQFAALRDAVGAMAKSLDVTGSLGLVRAAHGVLDGTNRAWLTEKARESDPALPHTGKDALLNVLAASAVMEVLATERHSKYGLITLLVKSALFCGWEPAIPDLIDAAERARHQLGRSVRRRDSASKSVAKEVKDALGGASDESEGATEVDGREAALGIVAERLDQTRAELLEVLMLQDEELNTLWWSYGGRSTTTNKLWSDIEPIERRAVLAVAEVQSLVRSPSPTSVLALLAKAIGTDSEKKLPVSKIAEAAVEATVTLESLPQDPLFPVSACIRQLNSMGTTDDTWKTVVKRTVGFDADQEVTVLTGAEQLLRELDVRDVL